MLFSCNNNKKYLHIHRSIINLLVIDKKHIYYNYYHYAILQFHNATFDVAQYELFYRNVYIYV